MEFRKSAGRCGLLLVVFIGCFVMTADASSESRNSWRGLNKELQNALSVLLAPSNPSAVLKNSDFMAWYCAWYCVPNDGLRCTARKDCVQPAQVYPEYFYNYTVLDHRVSIACVVSQILETQGGIPPELGRIVSSGVGGVVLFEQVGSDADLLKSLKSAGYDDVGFASTGHEWGVRPTGSGAQLHWYRDKGLKTVNAHIDFINPGTKMMLDYLDHYFTDKYRWEENHTTVNLLTKLPPDRCGLHYLDYLEAAVEATEDLKVQLERMAAGAAETGSASDLCLE